MSLAYVQIHLTNYSGGKYLGVDLLLPDYFSVMFVSSIIHLDKSMILMFSKVLSNIILPGIIF